MGDRALVDCSPHSPTKDAALNRLLYRLITGIGIVALVAGCEAELPDGPPTIRLGLDECVHCGMIISDQRSAAASIVVNDGKRRALLFDDIGDLLDYHELHKDLAIHARYVSDYRTRQWIEFGAAFYVHAPGTQTPMGSGLLAFASADAADAAAVEYSGRRVSAADLPAIRTQVATTGAACCRDEENE